MIQHVAEGHETRVERGDSLNLTDSAQVKGRGPKRIPLSPPGSRIKTLNIHKLITNQKLAVGGLPDKMIAIFAKFAPSHLVKV
jgi:hypothetical protein